MRSYTEMLKLAAEPQQDSDGTPLTWWQRMQLEIQQQQQRRETQQRPVYSSYIPSSGTFVDARPQTPQQQRFWQWWNGEEQAPRQQAAGAQPQTQQPVPTAQQAPAPVSSVTKPSNEPQQVPTQSGPMQLSSPSWQQTGVLGPEGTGYLSGLSRSVGEYQASLNTFRTQGLGAKRRQQPKPSTPTAPKPVQAQPFPHSPGYVPLKDRRKLQEQGKMARPQVRYVEPPPTRLQREQAQLASDRRRYGINSDIVRKTRQNVQSRLNVFDNRASGGSFRSWRAMDAPMRSDGTWVRNGRTDTYVPRQGSRDRYNRPVTAPNIFRR